MSELIQKNDNRATIRWKLLTGVSALALTAYVSSTALAKAEDAGQPQIWIELGGQLSRLEDSVETFAPPFEVARPSIFSPSAKFDKQPLYSIDEFASLSFQPEESNWVFGASIHYGRATSSRHVHQQTYPKSFYKKYYSGGTPVPTYFIAAQPKAAKFADTRARNSQQFTILDFTTGKDVGLGMFGNQGSSVVNFGVRFAQFRSKSNIAIKSDPDWHFHYKYPSVYWTKLVSGQPYHSNAASLTAQRSFRGVGPSISWKASAPFAGNPQDGELAIDWGLNAALLFGRQKTKTHHQTTARYQTGGTIIGSALLIPKNPQITLYKNPATPDHTRSRNVTVPNVGGFAGLSWQLQDFKMSFGYKADFFFGAIDGGIDARKNENRAFYGPYASISIGLGD